MTISMKATVMLSISVLSLMLASFLFHKKTARILLRSRDKAAVEEAENVLKQRLANISLSSRDAPRIDCIEQAPCDYLTIHKENTSPGLFYNYHHVDSLDKIKSSAAQPVPILSTTVSYSSTWIHRLMASIDYPVTKIIIVHDVSKSAEVNEKVRQGIDDSIVQYRSHWGNQTSIELIRHDPSRGCSAGFNEGLRHAMPRRKSRPGFKCSRADYCFENDLCPQDSKPAPWALVLNDDIAFRPGDLERISKGMHAHVIHHPEVQHGFVSFKYTFTDLGSRRAWEARPPFCAFAMTATTLNQVGLFDENFWPAYKEDNEYCIRLQHVGIDCIESDVLDNGVRLIHGDSRDSTYKPGSSGALDAKALRIIGETCGTRYIRFKWGALNHIPPTRAPYGGTFGTLHDWKLDKRRLNRMRVARDSIAECLTTTNSKTCVAQFLGTAVC